MDVLKLISYFDCIAGKHKEIESFLTGDTWEIAVGGVDVYPQLYLLQLFEADGNDNRLVWRVKFRIHTIQLRDETDENALLDLTYKIGNEILEFIRQGSEYVLARDWTAFSFTEDADDYLCGWAFTIGLTDVNRIDRCTINDAFLSFCDYNSLLINTISTGFILGININGVTQVLNGPYMVKSISQGVDELNRFKADLEALGYTISGVVVALGQALSNYSIIITQTSDIFAFIETQGGNSLMIQSNCT
jgi:hypothetical protein